MDGQSNPAFSATWRFVVAEWNSAVNGSLITTLLLCATIIVGIISVAVPILSKGAASLSPWVTVSAGTGTLLFVMVSLPYAAVRVAHRERVARIDAEEKADRDNRPRLSTEILVASAQIGNEIDTWVLQTAVDVRNTGSEQVRLDSWQTVLVFNGAEFPGRPYDSLLGGFIVIDHKPVQLIGSLGPIGGLDRARGTIASTVYNVPREATLSDCIVKARVRGVGCNWTEWATFQPPRGS